MPVRPTYPGVYVEEIPSGLRTVTGVATSTAAFIGTFSRGLLNEAVRVLSQSDFEREFGGLERNSEASYAVQQFFLNGGNDAYIVRIGHDGIATGTTAIAAAQATLPDVYGRQPYPGHRPDDASADSRPSIPATGATSCAWR